MFGSPVIDRILHKLYSDNIPKLVLTEKSGWRILTSNTYLCKALELLRVWWVCDDFVTKLGQIQVLDVLFVIIKDMGENVVLSAQLCISFDRLLKTW